MFEEYSDELKKFINEIMHFIDKKQLKKELLNDFNKDLKIDFETYLEEDYM